MGAHHDLQIRRLFHAAREPIGSFSVYIGLLERERLTPGAQAYLKAIRANMKRAADAFEEIDFWLENGYPRPVTPAVSASTSQRSPDGCPGTSSLATGEVDREMRTLAPTTKAPRHVGQRNAPR